MDAFPDIRTAVADAEKIEALAGYLSIFTVPVLILFADGKEVLREARFVHIEEFRQRISKIHEGYIS
ncbi:thioredoxin family protein [Indiicoccus explosivorum]|uniref:thioredoxin family protein n=1 Tax=Indiicoccus explosivorum TaxID=1917864 RepID=UPI001F4EB18D|nr:thioredoxin family protein [Indiicoccus explosivorum]